MAEPLIAEVTAAVELVMLTVLDGCAKDVPLAAGTLESAGNEDGGAREVLPTETAVEDALVVPAALELPAVEDMTPEEEPPVPWVEPASGTSGRGLHAAANKPNAAIPTTMPVWTTREHLEPRFRVTGFSIRPLPWMGTLYRTWQRRKLPQERLQLQKP